MLFYYYEVSMADQSKKIEFSKQISPQSIFVKVLVCQSVAQLG